MNDAFRREFQRVLPPCGSIGAGTKSQSYEADVEPRATAAADCKAADGPGKTTAIDVAVGDAAAPKNAAAACAGVNVQYTNDAAL